MSVVETSRSIRSFSPVAVIGLACRLPGANDPDEFWKLLSSGGHAIGPPSGDRLTADARIEGLIGGFLDKVDEFDAEFFGIAPREAAAIDPQQRLLLELAWEASEDANLPMSSLRGTDTGVFVAAIASDYATLVQEAGDTAITRHTLTGLSRGVLANRISYTFGLHGASLALDSAQSSGLAAVHAACVSLGSGESTAAFVAAANLNLTRTGALTAERFGGVSASGRASVFDAGADGYVRGEGAVVLLLKPLDRALAEGDRVHAVIRSTALNNDGASSSLTVPTAAAQAAVIDRALSRANLRPGDIQYVELHGTGTRVGDPIEAEALGIALGRARAGDDPLLVGSVKPNVGHLEGAAGLVGLLKAIVSVRNRKIPATLHHERPNPAIDLPGTNLRVVTAAQPWPHADRRVLAGVSSFGMGGTNAHVIVERVSSPEGSAGGVEVPAALSDSDSALTGVLPFVVSGASPAALAAQAARLGTFLSDGGAEWAWPSVASGLIRDRVVFGTRAVVLAADRNALLAGLTALARDTVLPAVVPAGAATHAVGVVFGGQGSQRAGAGVELYQRFPVFRTAFDAAVEALDRHLAGAVEFSVREVAFGVEGTAGAIDSTVYTQAVVFAVETALFRLLRSWGIEIPVVAGHSIGGVVTAHVAGVLSLEDAARLVAARGRLLGSLPTGGAMVAVEATEAEALEAISKHQGESIAPEVSLAAVNGPRAVVLSGIEAAVTKVADALSAEGRRTKRLAVSHAFHSSLMEPVLAEFEAVVAGLNFARAGAEATIVSDSTGAVVTPDELADPAYWVRHLRGTVRFADAVRGMRALGVDLFVEVSAEAVLAPTISAVLADESDPTVVAVTLRNGRDEATTALTAAATVFTNGHAVDWSSIVPRAPRIQLPTYAFQRQRFWIDSTATDLADPVRVSAAGEPAVARPVAPAPVTLADTVIATTAAVLGHADASRIDRQRTYRELGLDSLGAAELATALSRALGIRIDATTVYDFPTPAALLEHLAARLSTTGTTAPATDDGPARPVATPTEPIAIVALSGRFPGGADTPEQLWDLLARGGDAIGDFPADRGWDLAGLYDPSGNRPGSSSTRRGGFLTAAGEFDAAFFGISPREATAMDPQQRLVLEAAWELFERADIVPKSLSGSRTAVYLGATPQEYGPRLHQMGDAGAGYGLTGISPSVLSGRIAYTFGLAGPALTVDTACSSALVALHLAVRALRSGEADLALAGGVTVMANPGMFTEFSRQRGLAPDGRCKAFAAGADGTGWSEAVSLVLVERLSDARRLGHEVLAVVRGSAVNQDGASNGLTAPNGPAQQRVIRDALADAGLLASEVDVVEAHGTGTALGDPIEAQALLATYGQDRAAPVWLGSLKSNIGHTQAAAGTVGLTKMVLALRHNLIPATLHVDEPSPHVDWSSGAVELATEPRPWPRGARPRRAAVSSFGISGTNAHVIIEETPEAAGTLAAQVHELPGAAVPFVISGASAAALRGQARLLADQAARTPWSPAALASALVRTREVFGSRAVVTAADDRELADGLAALADGRLAPSVILGPASSAGGGVAVVFGGQGSQRAGAGIELYERFPVFRAAFDAATELLDSRLADAVEFSVRDVAFGAAGTDGLIDSTIFTQPVVFAVETALFRLIESWGIEVAVVAGHSIGGVVAAHVAGALSLADAANLVAARGRLLGSLPAGGAMVAVEATESEVLDAISRLPGEVRAAGISVAAVNGPRSVVVSGASAAVQEVAEGLSRTGSRTKRLAVSHGFHSPLMDPVLAEFRTIVAGLSFGETTLTVVSDSTGAVLNNAELADPEYWVRHLRGTVRFADTVRTLREAGAGLFLEVGADAVLTPMVSATLAQHDPAGGTATVATLRTGRSEVLSLLQSAATVFTHGHTVDWSAIVPPAPRTTLPTYAFQRQRYWIDTPAATVPAEHPGNGWFWERVREHDADALAAALGIGEPALRTILPALDAWRSHHDRGELLDSWTYRVDWRSIPVAGQGPESGDHWLLVSANDGTADRWVNGIGAALRRFGATATTVQVDPATAGRGEFAVAIAAVPSPVAKIVSLLPLAAAEPDPAGTQALVAGVNLVQAISDLGLAVDFRVITAGAVAVSADDRVRAPQQSWHWAFTGAAAVERAVRTAGVVDAPAEPDERLAARVIEALSDDGERELAVRDRDTWARRLVRARPDHRAVTAWRPRGTVLITGGTGALGAQVARRLARNGVQDLLLVSRRGPDAPGVAELVTELAGLGARVTVDVCDIGDRSAVAALLARIPADRPLTDVVHTAAVLDDALVDGLDRERIRRVHRVKVGGAWHLHDLTADLALSSFVLFSSITGIDTGAGQANYGPGNATLDALAEYRRALGLPATSIAWGHWDGAGIAGAEAGKQLRRSGLRPMDPELAVDALERAVAADETRIVVADVDWAAAVPSSRTRLLEELQPTAQPATEVDSGTAGLADRLAALGVSERTRYVSALVRTEVAAALGHTSAAAVADDRSLRDQGFTSLSAVELRNRLGQVTTLDLPATVVFDHPTVPELTDLIVRLLIPEESSVLDTVLGDLERIAGALTGPGISDDERAVAVDRIRRLVDSRTWSPPGSAADRTDRLSTDSDDDLIEFIGAELGIS
ncbi:SDR family NAD(P)-dependent oxidoreductase [Nocardia sp. SYP-A9097]|uniref:type I polyketide synthase n=1 Tax=Nocardia sp. SYP-A9097 TaxID=2663237 RepID=UPI00129A31A8|nr:type I polyketide synthase [Nocardia sp. SYP-A9097]MRH91233.1 SDR family NAD(P)-dependent oxidoreductase [Nocardia sp. SYP-A9097]